MSLVFHMFKEASTASFFLPCDITIITSYYKDVDMPTPTQKETEVKLAKPASKTSPQIVNMFRRTMILDEMMALKEKRYQEELAAWKKDIKNPPKGLNTQPPEDYLIRKHRQFYAHEMSVVAEYEKNEARFNDILDSDPDFKTKFEKSKSLPMEQRLKFLKEHESSFFDSVSPAVRDEYVKLKHHLQIDVQEAIVASYFTPNYMNSSPDFSVAKANIQGMVRASVPAGMKGTKGEHTGVINLFNQKYKGVKEQLKALESKYPSQARAGKALLATGTLTLNPSGYLIGKGVGAIMRTKAFASFSQKMGVHVKRVAEKTGLKNALIAKLKSPEGEFYKKLAVGSAQAITVGLVVAGFIEADKSFEIVANVSDALDGVYRSAVDGIDQTGKLAMEAYDDASEITAKFTDGAMSALNDASELTSKVAMETYGDATKLTSKLADGAVSAFDDVSEVTARALDDVADTFTIENGKAVVDSAKDLASDALNDLGQDFEAGLPDVGSGETLSVDTPLAASVELPEVKAPEVVVPEVVLPSVDDNLNNTLKLPEVETQEVTPPGVVVSAGVESIDNPLTTPQTTYEVQVGDTPSEIAELKLKEAGIPYDYERIMKVVHMMADANEGMDNIHYIQAGWDLKIPEISLEGLNEYTPSEPTQVLAQDVDLTLPPSLNLNGLSVSSAMELSEEIQSRFESANMVFSAADIDALTQDVLVANNVAEGANLRGAKLDVTMIDDIVSVHGVEGQKPSGVDIASITNDAKSPELKQPFGNDYKGATIKR